MHLKSLNIAPPGSWRYTCPHCPDPKITSVGVTFGQLMQRVQQHYQNMNHTSSNLMAEVEDGICQSLSPADQVEYCDTGIRQRTSIGWGEIVAFFTWLATWWVGGRELVAQPEAERRAAICAKCPYNVVVSGCGVCRQSIGVLRNKVMALSATEQDNNLRTCGVCRCDLRTIVHLPLDTLRHRGTDYSKVPWCWQNDGK